MSLILTLILSVSLVGCQNVPPDAPQTDTLSQAQDAAKDWGITLSAKDASATGLTLVIAQKNGEYTGTLQYGSHYSLEVWKDSAWEAVPYATEENIAWTTVAYGVAIGSETELSIDWQWIYGSLPAGRYRIAKGFTDFRAAGDYDDQMYYAEFGIK